MTPEALKALKESIKHWEENVAAEKPNDASIRWLDCALCRNFFVNGDCFGCPINDITGRSCGGTPYFDAEAALFLWRKGDGDVALWRTAAQAELDFLKSLRPIGV